MQRRAVLQGLMVGGVTLTTPLAAQPLRPPSEGRPRAGSAEPAAAAESGPPAVVDPQAPWALIAPLTAGSYLGAGWQIETLSQVKRGAAILTLAHRSGQRARVHICRRGDRPKGIAHTADLDLLLMNGGAGRRATAEGVGRAVKTVALRIAAHQQQAGAGSAPPTTLLTHRARLDRFGARELCT
jgi:hypothetical protein